MKTRIDPVALRKQVETAHNADATFMAEAREGYPILADAVEALLEEREMLSHALTLAEDALTNASDAPSGKEDWEEICNALEAVQDALVAINPAAQEAHRPEGASEKTLG